MKSAAAQHRRSFWLKQLHQWHWISAALSLIGMLLFAITGITLNHAGQIEAEPKVVSRKATLPPDRLAVLAKGPEEGKRPLPIQLEPFLDEAVGADVAGREAEWSADEVYLALPRPGGDGWVSIDRATGAVTAEETDRGPIAWLNDLHKGRNAGTAWKWFIDIFAGAYLIFAITGLFLLQLLAAKRRSTWGIVAAGLVTPAIIAVYFVH